MTTYTNQALGLVFRAFLVSEYYNTMQEVLAAQTASAGGMTKKGSVPKQAALWPRPRPPRPRPRGA